MYHRSAFGLVLASILLLNPVAGKPPLGQTPQMGWNSWNTFKSQINSSVIENTVQLFEHLGLKDVGYEYILLDEGWSDYSRTADGYLQPNLTSFPNGIKPLIDDIHAKGLKIGLYGDSGILTCGFRPGSWGYEERDAQTLARWGVDYWKYDNCGGFQAMTEPPQVRFGIMQKALELSGRQIFYSVCEWGYQFPWHWGGSTFYPPSATSGKWLKKHRDRPFLSHVGRHHRQICQRDRLRLQDRLLPQHRVCGLLGAEHHPQDARDQPVPDPGALAGHGHAGDW